MLERNYLKEAIQSGRPAIGIWNTLASPLVTETLARAGFDFLIIDFEHGPYQLDSVHDYATRCERHACSPIVRIPALSDWMALQALDQGAHGVMVPHVEDAAAVRALTAAVKYHPLGTRGYSPYTKAGGFSGQDGAAYAARANALTLSLAVIESREGLNRLDEMLAVEGLDVVYFGAYDLSQALGVPGQVRHPKVLEAISAGVRRASAAGKCAGGFVAQSQDDVKWLLDMGMRFITYQVDSALLFRAANDVTAWFREEAAR